MRTFYSTLRLGLGCVALFGGIACMLAMEERWTGALLAGVGLAITLHETAYIHACYMRSNEE
ncbi:MAG: hypothetical protein L0Z55_10760 [Planctomycetes bacterium]|nr:hypothetical protein [Planctomycetota bacterium]